ncbi:tail fiber domain-containing protein [Mesobacterium pallidum]|uniref:tail fiber domain-containing protein n=1 Tax=Mesobacterium pallidum TaxID=2872037 RepID=UPI001EE1BD55|nr:tail fiber domain-containing protein [Mesobacterium pallidum]
MGGSAPKPDKNIGKAALKSAELGEDFFAWMQGQADITNDWAEEDRNRYLEVFRPVEDRYIADAASWSSPERKAMEADKAVADVRQQQAIQRQANERSLIASGVDPRSGRYQAETQKQGNAEALAAAGAGNMARSRVDDTARQMQSNVINMGNGMAVNPATSIGLSNTAAGAGFNGAINGYEAQGDLLNQQYGQQMASWEASQNGLAGIGSALGQIAGAFLPAGFLSSKEAKENKREAPGILDALEGVPVERWNYKEGLGDGGEHVGPYAEDFTAATGLGDGKTINVADAFGITLGAVKELNAKVDKLTKGKGVGIGEAA